MNYTERTSKEGKHQVDMRMAKEMGKSNDYSFFAKRSENYRNLWNPETALIHPRNMDGSWIEEFSPIADKFNTLGFCESNSAIYTNYVPHNLDGLIDLFGGKEIYTDFLSSSFAKASENRFIAAHGVHAKSWVDYENQPSCQMAHLFNYSGAPWLSQKWVRQVKEVTFGDTSPYGGYNGDEDQGQMGALGVLLASGLFQMDGGASVNSSYEITAPIFDEIEIQLNPLYNAGEKFVIKTDNNSADNVYISTDTLEVLDSSTITTYPINWSLGNFTLDSTSKTGSHSKSIIGMSWGLLAYFSMLYSESLSVSIEGVI